MSFDLVSDLHTEFVCWHPTQPTSRVLVIAGDYATALHPEKTIQSLLNLPYEHIVFVLGNHDFYHGDYNDTYLKWLAYDNPKLHVLLNRSVLIDGIQFIGSTLWSDTSKNGIIIKQSLSDYRAIHNFDLQTGLNVHRSAVEFLDRTLTETKQPVVVITHHLPSFSCIDKKYKDCAYNDGFATDLDWLLKKHANVIKVWVHGHTHTALDMKVEGVRIVCNPRGYPGENKRIYTPLRIL